MEEVGSGAAVTEALTAGDRTLELEGKLEGIRKRTRFGERVWSEEGKDNEMGEVEVAMGAGDSKREWERDMMWFFVRNRLSLYPNSEENILLLNSWVFRIFNCFRFYYFRTFST